MTTKWTISAADRRAIRAYAARVEGMQPRQIDLDVGQRYNLEGGGACHDFNIYLVDDTPDWEESDLHDLWKFSDVKAVQLDPQGRALIDIYVYKNDRDRELLTNVQAYVETVDGKPKLVKLESTDAYSLNRRGIEDLMQGP